MSEYELIDAYQSVEASWQGAVSIFISIVFAFLATAYFVGAKLTRTQAIIVTGLYSAFCLLTLTMLTQVLIRMTQFGADILELSPERAFAGSESMQGGIVLWGTVFLGAYLAGLIFMFSVRRSARKNL